MHGRLGLRSCKEFRVERDYDDAAEGGLRQEVVYQEVWGGEDRFKEGGYPWNFMSVHDLLW